MSDDNIDVVVAHQEKIKQIEIDRIRAKAKLKPGYAGDCDLCGEWSGRLIDGACAPCRDRYKL